MYIKVGTCQESVVQLTLFDISNGDKNTTTIKQIFFLFSFSDYDDDDYPTFQFFTHIKVCFVTIGCLDRVMSKTLYYWCIFKSLWKTGFFVNEMPFFMILHSLNCQISCYF